MVTKVMLRELEGKPIAFFPEIPATMYSNECLSYMTVGQHGAASLDLLYTLPKRTPEDYPEFWAELANQYPSEKLVFVRRKSAKMDTKRLAEINLFK